MSDLEETLAPAPVGVLAAYREYVHAIAALSDGALGELADAHAALRDRRLKRVDAAAQRAADLAYDSGRIAMDHDGDPGTVVGLTNPEDDIAATLLARGDGIAIIVGLAILVHDQLDPATFDTITGWWIAAAGPLPPALRHSAAPADKPDVEREEAPPAPPVATGGRRRVIPPPAPATTPAPQQQRRAAAQAPRQARTVHVRGRNDPMLSLLGMLMIFSPLGALAALGTAFYHASMEDGTSGRWLAVVGVLIATTFVAAAAHRFVAAKRRR